MLATRHRGVDQNDAVLPQVGRDALRLARPNRRRQQDGPTPLHALGEPYRSEGRIPRLISVHHHDEGGLRTLSHRRRILGRVTALTLQPLQPGRSRIVSMHTEAGAKKVPGHAGTHVAQTDEPDFFHFNTPGAAPGGDLRVRVVEPWPVQSGPPYLRPVNGLRCGTRAVAARSRTRLGLPPGGGRRGRQAAISPGDGEEVRVGVHLGGARTSRPEASPPHPGTAQGTLFPDN